MAKRIENETVIKFNDGDGKATVHTHMNSIKRRMKRLGYSPDQQSTEDLSVYRIPKQAVRIRAYRSLGLLHKIKQGTDDIPEEVSFNGLEKFEKETIINFNEAEKEAWLGTRHKGVVNLMRRLGVRLYSMQADYFCFLIPKRWVRIRKKLSTEERELESLRGQERYVARKSKATRQEQIKYAVSPQKPVAVEGQTEKKLNLGV